MPKGYITVASAEEYYKNEPISSKIKYMIPIILVNVYLLHYIIKLESVCECSKDWKRTFIKYSLLITIAMTLLYIFGPLPYKNLSNFIEYLYAIVGFISLIVIFLYIRQLRTSKCKCSESNARILMEVINYIKSGWLLLIAIFGGGLVAGILGINRF